METEFDGLNSIVENEISTGSFPGAVILVHNSTKVLNFSAYGLRAEYPEREKMTTDTIFDLASLTKVVATTTTTLKLIEEGKLELSTPVNRYNNIFSTDEIKIRHLLTHTSGLPAWADLFSGDKDRNKAIERLLTDKWPVITPVIPPMHYVIYSDLNFILIGLILEQITGSRLDKLSREKVFAPLDMEDTYFNPPEDCHKRVAPTEKNCSTGEVLRGVVHDENAFALGGSSGHAGLFSTARDLSKFTKMLLNNGIHEEKRYLAKRSIDLMGENFTVSLNQNRSLGWQLQGDNAESAGDLLPDGSFGHTGFTGGSIWLEPGDQIAIIILTNRVHPTRSRGSERINSFRSRVHNLIIGSIS